eukprot:2630535-Pyramimonas_sp.AAC.1
MQPFVARREGNGVPRATGPGFVVPFSGSLGFSPSSGMVWDGGPEGNGFWVCSPVFGLPGALPELQDGQPTARREKLPTSRPGRGLARPRR